MRPELSDIVRTPPDEFTLKATTYATKLLDSTLANTKEHFNLDDPTYARKRDWLIANHVPDELSPQCIAYLDERRRHSRFETHLSSIYKANYWTTVLMAWCGSTILLASAALIRAHTEVDTNTNLAIHTLLAIAGSAPYGRRKRQLKEETIDLIDSERARIDAEYTGHILTTLLELHHNVYNKLPSA